MKTPFLFFLLLSISILTGAVSCKKYQPPKPDNPYGLPDATQTGAWTFACLKNGHPWIAGDTYEGLIAIAHPNSLNVSGSLNILDTAGLEVGVESIGFSILKSLSSIQTNYLYDLSDSAIGNATIDGGGDSCFAGASYEYGSPFFIYAILGQLMITKLDTVKNIVSGTFWMDFPSEYCDTVKITEGRFDMNFWRQY